MKDIMLKEEIHTKTNLKGAFNFILVDDDPVNNWLCELTIGKVFKNAHINQFTEPEIALEFIHEEYSKPGSNIPTILFLDINMPTMTGWDFLDDFKNFSRAIQQQFTIFILSSSVDPREKEKAARNPLVHDFISKPLNADQLKQIINEG